MLLGTSSSMAAWQGSRPSCWWGLSRPAWLLQKRPARRRTGPRQQLRQALLSQECCRLLTGAVAVAVGVELRDQHSPLEQVVEQVVEQLVAAALQQLCMLPQQQGSSNEREQLVVLLLLRKRGTVLGWWSLLSWALRRKRRVARSRAKANERWIEAIREIQTYMEEQRDWGVAGGRSLT